MMVVEKVANRRYVQTVLDHANAVLIEERAKRRPLSLEEAVAAYKKGKVVKESVKSVRQEDAAWTRAFAEQLLRAIAAGDLHSAITFAIRMEFAYSRMCLRRHEPNVGLGRGHRDISRGAAA